MSLQMLAGLVFLAVSASVVGIYMLFVGRSEAAREKTIETRLSELGTLPPTEAQSGGDEDSLVRKQNAGALPNIEVLAKSALKGSSFERWLEQSGMALSLSGCLLISLSLGGAFALLSVMFSHRVWVMPVGFALGICLLPAYVRHRRTKRLLKFEEHFPEALDLLSRGVRAGHAFSAGMKMVADELPEPVGPEFRKAFEEQNYGLPLKESLNNLALRIPLLDVRFFSTAVLIQRETGGNLSEILDTLANVVRERFKIQRQVRVHTAHGRFTGWVLMALPAFLAVALSFINPDHMKLLFTNRLGQMMVIASVIMQAVGFVWIKKVIKIEV